MARTFINNLDLHLDINDVVYIRMKDENGECIISAAKYLGWYTDVRCGGCVLVVNYRFLLPNGHIHHIKSESLSIYETIEDAISDDKKCITRTTLMDFLRLESNGFAWRQNCIGMMEMSRIMYKWNGYQAQAVSKCYNEFEYSRDADGIIYEFKENKNDTETYYFSLAECLDKNKVKVMTF